MAQVLKKDERSPRNMDVRAGGRAASSLAGTNPAQAAANAKVQAAAASNAVREFQARVPGAQVSLSPFTGSVEMVRSSGTLTGPAPGQSGYDIVRSFFTANSTLYGLSAADLPQLHFIGESVSPGSGLRMVRVEQMVDGHPVFQSETRVTMDRDGRIVRTVGLMARDASGSAAPLSALISPEKALVAAMASVSIPLEEARMSREQAAGDALKLDVIVPPDGTVAGKVPSQIVYFPIAPGVLVPAWSQVTFTTGEGDWYTLVDARTGALLWRKNIREYASAQDARFRVYVQADGVTPADNPAPQSPNTVAPGSGTQFPEIAPTIVGMHTVMGVFGNVSQNGWIDDCPVGGCTANETQTLGNNVIACMDSQGGADADVCDTVAAFVIDGNGRPTGNPDANSRNRDFLGTTPRDFQTNYLPPPQGGNPEAGQTATGNGTSGTAPIDEFRRGVLTHLFYVVNWYHDRLYNLGFDEAAGNFQQTNFSHMGSEGDRINADAEDNSGTSNANFATPPDGTSGRAQMYRFTGPTIDRDGDLDQEVLVHELTHGTSNRLIGNAAGLNWDPGRGMGEGWSDFYALSLLNNTNADDPNGRYASGAYATYKLAAGYTDNYVYGIRRFPYSTDNTVNPMTWADVDDVTNNLSGGIAPDPLGFNVNGAAEVHNIGEIWCLTLWEVRGRVIAANAGDVPTGNQKMLQLTTDALKMTPINPSFTDARDAIIDADCATNTCANEQSIWAGFADRGLGYKAVDSGGYGGRYVRDHLGIGESFLVPYLDVANVATDVTIDDSSGNNNGAIDPGEPIKITVKLTNPWRSAAKNVASATATLTTSTSGVNIYDNASTYPAIPAQGSAVGDTFLFTVPASATAGQALKFTITSNSSLGSASVNFTLRVGKANGTDPAVTYTRDLTGAPRTVTDNRPRGVFDTMTITDDFEIADLNFRVDSLTGPALDDLTVMLRAPNGYGGDMVALIDGLNDCGGASITNMVIDDDLPQLPTNDMVEATTADAPYSKSWLPVYNSPWATLVDHTRPNDPVGELSRLDGLSTQGTWTALVSDVFSAAAGGCPAGNGTFNGWSLLVTPVHFDIAPFAATAAISGTQTVAGAFSPGGTVTYTVTLTNNGSGGQMDNPGNEFSEVLPASLTLMNASSSSGAAVANVGTNTVTWNGQLAPLGDSVTITITATINSGTGGQTVSAQGIINYDADSNGTNEATGQTDDPSKPGASDPTTFVVAQPSLSINDVTIPEGNGGSSSANFTVTLSSSSTQTVTVDFATGNGTATAPVDYTAASSTLTFAPGQTTKTISVSVNGDTDFEGDETFFVNLTNPNNATISDGQGQGTITNDDAAPTPTPAAQTVNLSTRMRTDTGNNVGIGGFIITGAAPKHVIIRALGPSLTRFGFTTSEILADPTLEVHGPGAFGTVTNNNWRDSQEAQIKGDGLPPTNDLESAIDATLPPGAYTAIVSGNGNPTGICLVEVYDLDTAATSKLANLSTRAFVGTGNNVVIAGFVLGNNQGNDRIVVRGLGPSLSSFGIANTLADPTLELRDENGTLILANNDWQDNATQAGEITSAGLAPTNPKESAIAATLPPGLYTAILAGLNSSTGVGTVEVYDRGP